MDIKNHFAEVGKMVKIGSNAKILKKLEKEKIVIILIIKVNYIYHFLTLC